jgi:hypothetical protein
LEATIQVMQIKMEEMSIQNEKQLKGQKQDLEVGNLAN